MAITVELASVLAMSFSRQSRNCFCWVIPWNGGFSTWSRGFFRRLHLALAIISEDNWEWNEASHENWSAYEYIYNLLSLESKQERTDIPSLHMAEGYIYKAQIYLARAFHHLCIREYNIIFRGQSCYSSSELSCESYSRCIDLFYCSLWVHRHDPNATLKSSGGLSLKIVPCKALST